MFFFRLISDLVNNISNQLPLSLLLLFLSLWLILEANLQPLSCYLIMGVVIAINIRALSIWAKTPYSQKSARHNSSFSKSARPWNKF